MKKKGESGKKNRKKFFTKKKVLIGIGVLIVIMFASGFGVLKASENPSFCGLCHNMDHYLESYEEGNLLAKRHADADVGCQDCHVETIGKKMQKGVKFVTGNYETPMEKRDFGTREFCLDCHDDPNEVEKDYETVTEETQFVDSANPAGTNPHDNHNGDLECNVCHNVHQESEVLCKDCHFFKWINELDETWKE